MAIEGATETGQRRDVGDFHSLNEAGSIGAHRANPSARAIATITLVGALLAHAGGLKKLAVEQSENADRIEKSYMTRKERSR